ncbi:allophanate hydrolase subunit 1 [Psychroflexus torquis ATCC 700755]|uniref:Allophanate hydrolase subunit 1 n=1 Tax=Psychroflexus torquis (strain ATCC 700755 / CIP 106069 / ACAM 623) TaxID=313595 RepID=K4II03_PSYTT|nr:5-oxoprolinase subunit PxpB [Psychroflexus torquis]AFU70172.1 allophanate hydrolase subunit 1 [Psychroflexus torquis ATCC 700755]
MMNESARIFQLSERSILIEFNRDITKNLLYFLLNLKENIFLNKSEHILQVTNTYNSLLVIYKFTINNFHSEKNNYFELISNVSTTNIPKSPTRKIPVCYELDFGLDLEEVSEKTGLSISEIIKRHMHPIYTVYFIGFLPGFPYLGGMDSSLFCRRKSNPRSEINSGAVGIAGSQTGIYPSSSPGGWQIIGRTPLSLFDSHKTDTPCVLSPGDSLQFESITKEEFDNLQSHPSDIKL